jgi:hypothetical protein
MEKFQFYEELLNLPSVKIVDVQISDTLISAYNKSNLNTINNANDADIIFDDLQIEDCKKKDNDYNNIYITKYSDDDEEEDDGDEEDDIDDI